MRTFRIFTAVYAAVMFLVGVALFALWLLLDLHGFPKGLCQGAGGALIVGSVYLAVAHVRRRSTDSSGREYWLPSRDAGEQP
ncbi:hypothetical protein [Arthrobacter sp. zg-Y1110]|uniref:hypothetical protein n=1 Tax=Arthrobacter sp. zg-Y1110 TaxID=2886932 RepID=UPI001D1419E6|nr:hypothetical protein [Arthrobacter sp. zg-Y1110]MCC3289775.1 hypothetical protein [Arthrobacter sp. zg-Y1110]UWX84808.1 hypothetical protein N2K99_15340 [Arthrobacter sp. zg-Y1110]